MGEINQESIMAGITIKKEKKSKTKKHPTIKSKTDKKITSKSSKKITKKANLKEQQHPKK